jgi:hypothetical protein
MTDGEQTLPPMVEDSTVTASGSKTFMTPSQPPTTPSVVPLTQEVAVTWEVGSLPSGQVVVMDRYINPLTGETVEEVVAPMSPEEVESALQKSASPEPKPESKEPSTTRESGQADPAPTKATEKAPTTPPRQK